MEEVCKLEIERKYISEDYKKFLKAGMKCKKKLRHFLAKMNEKNYYSYTNSDFSTKEISVLFYNKYFFNIYIDEEEYNVLFHSSEMTYIWDYNFLTNELKRIYIDKLENGHKDNLTYTYYAEKLFNFMKLYHLKYIWQEMQNISAENLLLDQEYHFIMMWLNHIPVYTYMFLMDFKNQLTVAPKTVMSCLKDKHPNHPLLSLPDEQLLFWEHNNIAETQWDYNDGRQILEIICESLRPCVYVINNSEIVSREFSDCIRERITTNHRLMFVMEEKSNIMVAALFKIISRKFGIFCDLIFPPGSHSLLIWKPKYNITNSDNEMKCFHIQLIWKDNNVQEECPKICELPDSFMEYYNTCNKMNTLQLVPIMIDYFKEIITFLEIKETLMHLYEFERVIKPDDASIIMNLSEYYEERNRSLSSLMTALEKIDCSPGCTTTTITKINVYNILILRQEVLTKALRLYEQKRKEHKPKRRKEQMKFAVGMIVRSTSSEVNKTGVINGWLELMISSDMRMHYVVLCDNETVECIAEDDLEKLQSPMPIDNTTVDRFFCEFRDTYYMPNNMLAKEYPEDILYLTNEL